MSDPSGKIGTVTAPDMATRASALLLAVAAGRPGASTALATELYTVLFAAARQRARAVGGRIRAGTDGIALPPVPPADWDSVAHDVTVHALNRLVANARRFDPDRGDGLMWALRQVNSSYVDVVRDTYQLRRALRVVPTDDEQLIPVAEAHRPGPDTAALVEARQQLDAALAALTLEERQVTLALSHYGYSYAETADLVFGDAAATGRVDRVRRSAKRKLALAEVRWRASADDAPAAEAPGNDR